MIQWIINHISDIDRAFWWWWYAHKKSLSKLTMISKFSSFNKKKQKKTRKPERVTVDSIFVVLSKFEDCMCIILFLTCHLMYDVVIFLCVCYLLQAKMMQRCRSDVFFYRNVIFYEYHPKVLNIFSWVKALKFSFYSAQQKRLFWC